MIRCDMTPEQFETAKEKLLADEGINLTGNEGEVEAHGVKASYSFNGSELLISVTKAPFLIPKSACESRIASALQVQGLTPQTVG